MQEKYKLAFNSAKLRISCANQLGLTYLQLSEKQAGAISLAKPNTKLVMLSSRKVISWGNLSCKVVFL